MNEPSAMMLKAFERSGCGAPSLTCGACGRAHHAPASDFLDAGEEEQMRAVAAAEPDRVQLHDGDGVGAVMIGGIAVVLDCKCYWLGRLESLLWRERESILKYFQLRREAAMKDAQAIGTALGESEGQA